MREEELLRRITFNPAIFGGKPIVRGRRLAVEHVLAMLAAGDSVETVLEGYPWLEPEDVQACPHVLKQYRKELISGSLITATQDRVRVRPPDEPQKTR